MNTTQRIKQISDIVRYNLKIVFANKFIYFLIAAVAFFLMIVGIMLFSNSVATESDIYNTLIFPGILIIFYPVIFNIQNDKDTRMLEIIFGVPNYRYKVYLVRFIISMVLLFFILIIMSEFTVFAILRIPVLKMVYQLMYPLLFLSCLSFLFSTLVRNASGAAVIVIIIGLVFWIMHEPLQYSKWNVFLNPFDVPSDISMTIWKNVQGQNRLMLIIGSIISMLWALINLQRREKFI
ncbi:MAG: hypothetical protein A2W99_08580 [Bacteroidetes bacterium GWF2_33_16]|nr:MAG: hypothetical protein A2X00_00575 [Bacteroidetes bacterium GWE2_32_14]OFY05556.1 MAG: hypothetical protein A2W99_08580 [Bacteroidetes bacterium GWF2_33_16]